WRAVIELDQLAVDLLMATVAAAIGLHLELGNLLAAGARSLALGGIASTWMAGLSLAMVALTARGADAAASLVGVVGVFVAFVAYRLGNAGEAQLGLIRRRFASGAPLSLREATQLLDAFEREGAIDDTALRRVLTQLFPAIGELIPVRE